MNKFFSNNFPWQVLIARAVYSWTSFPWLKTTHRRLVFPWQALFARVYDSTSFKPCYASFWTKLLVKERLVNLYCITHEQMKLVKGKPVNLCCTHEQIKLVKGKLVIYAVHTSKWNLSRKTCNLCCTRANKTCQGKTWSCVQGLSYMIYFECEFRRQQWRSSSTCKYDSEEKMRSMNKTWAWQSIFVWYIYRDG